MKILFLTRGYGEHAGGMERLSYEFIQAISSQPGIEAQIIFHKGSRITSPFFNLLAFPRSLRAARQSDVIHLGDPMLSFLGWMIKKFIGKPVVVTVHGLDIVYPSYFYQLYLKLFFHNFDHHFPISRYVSQILNSKFHIPPSKFHIQTPGLSDRFYDPSIKKDNGGKIILFTSGRLVKRKGHAWFIREVLPKLPKNIIYVIAGDGPEFGHLRGVSEADSSEVGRVLLLGKVSDDQLKILYNTADAFIMPNIPVENDVEGFGLVLLEAASCNLPVFAADLDGIPDAIHDGKNGTLLPAANAGAWIKTLQSFPYLKSHSRSYTLEHFSWQALAPMIAKSLSAVVPGRSR